MSARDFGCCSVKVFFFLVFWKKLSFLCCSHIKSGPEYLHFYTGKCDSFGQNPPRWIFLNFLTLTELCILCNIWQISCNLVEKQSSYSSSKPGLQNTWSAFGPKFTSQYLSNSLAFSAQILAHNIVCKKEQHQIQKKMMTPMVQLRVSIMCICF